MTLRPDTVSDIRENVARTLIANTDDRRIHRVTIGEGDTAEVIEFVDFQGDAVAALRGYSASDFVQGEASDVAGWVEDTVHTLLSELDQINADDTPVAYDAGCAPLLEFNDERLAAEGEE